MILLTVGGQLPFDRLVKLVDASASRFSAPIFAQVGQTAFKPSAIDHVASLAPADFLERFRAAKVIIGHAGIGTILKAREHKKPIVIVPRRAAFGEHRNDHQLATARALEGTPGVFVSLDGLDLVETVNRLLDEPAPSQTVRSRTYERLIEALEMKFEQA